ncbi:flagellar biosynthesis repressor FlbT [Hyphococcus luteus]|uniref:Flagellar biosynthesis repressor FlbT n=1 Tax=Hyphococcus luteus TaxID=2058213 RepID=A0A2S7K6G4_9PROT|nr:flagellar biosynthesis repressor FlbT [Marinicaulis flavus]PQA88105.1 flagellar biosynthesis repressor FlbT [Marinicaulis flavus]
MGGLILKLRPHEELMINGVLVENGERNTRLRVKTENAHILRLKDALKPEEATTPLKRAYYIAQLAVSGQLSSAEAAAILKEALASKPGFTSAGELNDCVDRHDFYQVMRCLRDAALADRNGAGDSEAGEKGAVRTGASGERTGADGAVAT